MKKSMIMIVISILILEIIFALLPNVNAQEINSNTNLLSYEDLLTVSGTKVVNKTGKSILLRGLNIGGWLLPTIYMSPVQTEEKDGVKKIECATDIYNTLEERFGIEDTKQLLDIYYEHYITTKDLDKIAKTGANVVRIPFWWRNFMNEDGSYIMKNGEIDFSQLDFIVEECGKRGIYVILDLHGAPGSQNGQASTGIVTSDGRPGLFSDDDAGRANRELTVKLWHDIASHFKDNPVIAGYDILNEPWGKAEGYQLERGKVFDLYDWIYKSIRIVDKNHIIIMESSWGKMSDLPDPKNYGWENIMYSIHDYSHLATEEYTDEDIIQFHENKLKEYLDTITKYNVPLYIGELNCYNNHNNAWKHVLNLYEQSSIHYTPWSYKSTLSANTYWGILYRGLDGRSPKLSEDSFETIKEIWSKTSDNMTFNEDGYNLLLEQFGGRIIKKIILDTTKLTLTEGKTATLTVTFEPENAINSEFIWSSSEKEILEVDSTGTITAKKAGNAIITVTDEDKQAMATCNVTVIARGDINKDGNITVTDLLQLKRQVVGLVELTTEEKEIADMNEDGKLTTTDIVKLKRKIIGLE